MQFIPLLKEAGEFLHNKVKGFVLDDELLKNGSRFGIDYFNQLLERVRDIRSSERRFNQKITDIYATSFDYKKDAQVTRDFFATVQNKLIYVVSGLDKLEQSKWQNHFE